MVLSSLKMPTLSKTQHLKLDVERERFKRFADQAAVVAKMYEGVSLVEAAMAVAEAEVWYAATAALRRLHKELSEG